MGKSEAFSRSLRALPQLTFCNAPTRNDVPADVNLAALFPLLCEARLNDEARPPPGSQASSQSLLNHIPGNIRQAFVSTIMAKRQTRVIQSEQM